MSLTRVIWDSSGQGQSVYTINMVKVPVRQTHIQTKRQAVRQRVSPDGRAERQTDGQTGGETDGWTDGETDQFNMRNHYIWGP